MSIYNDFARRDDADAYNSAVFSLINYLCIRVGMTVKQKLDQNDVHPMELKMFKHIHYQMKKIKILELKKHNPPMFSAACSKLSFGLQALIDSVKEKEKDQSNERDVSKESTPSNIDSSFSSINNSIHKTMSFKSKISMKKRS